MNTSFARCSLYLYPKQHNYVIKTFSSFIHDLQNIGLISNKIDTQSNDNSYLTGDSFLEHIAYMGCSPAIQFEAGEDSKTFCHINIHQEDIANLIVSKIQARAPHCPNCNKPVINWQKNKTNNAIYCDQCLNTASIEAFNWRKMAGYAQLFIEITDIFPKEAIPQQALLDKLTNFTDVDWQYFYSCK